MSAQYQMEARMKEVFSAAGKELSFRKWKQTGEWQVYVDKKLAGEAADQWKAFQKALDKSGVGGKITFKLVKSDWKFSYAPRKEAANA
jgi:hypothetical protein